MAKVEVRVAVDQATKVFEQMDLAGRAATRVTVTHRGSSTFASATSLQKGHPRSPLDRPGIDEKKSDECGANVMLHGPNAQATMSASSARQNAPPCDPSRSVITTSAPALRSASAHRVAFSRNQGSCVPSTR
jgi:hypothetical protein